MSALICLFIFISYTRFFVWLFCGEGLYFVRRFVCLLFVLFCFVFCSPFVSLFCVLSVFVLFFY